MAEILRVGSVYRQARSLLRIRRGFLTGTPFEQWAVISPIVLAAILLDEERELLPPSVRLDVAKEQKIAFGEEFTDKIMQKSNEEEQETDEDEAESDTVRKTDRIGRFENRVGKRSGTAANPSGGSGGGTRPGRVALANGRRAGK